jgi:hypothetical protein
MRWFFLYTVGEAGCHKIANISLISKTETCLLWQNASTEKLLQKSANNKNYSIMYLKWCFFYYNLLLLGTLCHQGMSTFLKLHKICNLLTSVLTYFKKTKFTYWRISRHLDFRQEVVKICILPNETYCQQPLIANFGKSKIKYSFGSVSCRRCQRIWIEGKQLSCTTRPAPLKWLILYSTMLASWLYIRPCEEDSMVWLFFVLREVSQGAKQNHRKASPPPSRLTCGEEWIKNQLSAKNGRTVDGTSL